jgi:hypothetical protein
LVNRPHQIRDHHTMRNRVRQIAVLFFAALDIVSSFWLGSSLDQGQDSTPVYFLPFGLTFAIWGVIFASGMIYAVYQALPGQGNRVLHQRIGGWVALNAALTALWNFTAGLAGQPNQPGYQPLLVVATVFILMGMLYALTRVFIVFREMHGTIAGRDRWLVLFPVTVFFAWLNVAMIANTTAALDAVGFTGEPNGALWAAGMLLVASLLSSLMILYTRTTLVTITYAAVIVWATVGIFFNNIDRSLLVAVLSLIVAGVAVVVASVHVVRRRIPARPGMAV